MPPANRPSRLSAAPGTDGGMRSRDFALVAGGALLWGTGGIAGTFLAAGSDLAAVAVATYRLLVGGGVLVLALVLARRLRRVPRSSRVARRIVATGALAALYQGCYFAAVSLVSVSTATLVALGAAPVLVAAATVVSTRSRPSARVVVAMTVALMGLVLLIGVPAPEGARPGSGLGLALVAAGAFAAITILNSRPVPGLEPLALTGLSFTLGGVLLVPFAALTGAALAPPRGVGGWLLLGFLGVVPTALAYGAYFGGLRRVPATTATLLALLEPLTAAVGAAVLLDERLGVAGVVGGALLAVAVALLRPRRRG